MAEDTPAVVKDDVGPSVGCPQCTVKEGKIQDLEGRLVRMTEKSKSLQEEVYALRSLPKNRIREVLQDDQERAVSEAYEAAQEEAQGKVQKKTEELETAKESVEIALQELREEAEGLREERVVLRRELVRLPVRAAIAAATQGVRDLEIPKRLQNILTENDIESIAQLVSTSHEQLLDLKGMGPAGVEKIHTVLQETGLAILNKDDLDEVTGLLGSGEGE